MSSDFSLRGGGGGYPTGDAPNAEGIRGTGGKLSSYSRGRMCWVGSFRTTNSSAKAVTFGISGRGRKSPQSDIGRKQTTPEGAIEHQNDLAGYAIGAKLAAISTIS